MFSGKQFRRVRCENIDELLAASHVNDDIIRALKMKAPLVTYTVKDDVLIMDLECEDRRLSHSFRLGKELEMEKKDGGKVKMTYTLEGDNVLKQVIKMPDGKTAYFRREFSEKDVKMIVTMDGIDLTATIYYDVVQ